MCCTGIRDWDLCLILLLLICCIIFGKPVDLSVSLFLYSLSLSPAWFILVNFSGQDVFLLFVQCAAKSVSDLDWGFYALLYGNFSSFNICHKCYVPTMLFIKTGHESFLWIWFQEIYRLVKKRYLILMPLYSANNCLPIWDMQIKLVGQF